MTQAIKEASKPVVDFNSHAHVERDRLCYHERRRQDISTHTLTWSVTGLAMPQGRSVRISTHTLTWSVTEITENFFLCNKFISTHTLTWSVTAYRL